MLSATLACAVLLSAQAPYDLRKDTNAVPGQPVERYFTHDKFSREVTFYVSKARDANPAPLVVYVQGSGCGSNFVDMNGRVVPSNGFMTLYDVSKGAARLLVVEKPGVKYLDKGDRGGATDASPEFKKEHTLERWAEAVGAALKASKRISGIDRKRILVAGHSEGGLVACKVAADNPEVTHAATLAGGGVTQLYDLMALLRKGVFGGSISNDPEKRVAYLVDEWKKVQADPMSDEKLFFGHPYRRWTTFLASSPIEELSNFKGKIYIAQGDADTAVDVSSADALYAQLLSRGKDVTYERLPGKDHGFSTSDQPGKGWGDQMLKLLDWFVGKLQGL
jgi:dienelactone hydrolase